VVRHRNFLNTTDGTGRRAGFGSAELPTDILGRVIGKRDAGITALLRAIMDKTVLADVQVPGSRPAMPDVGPASSQILLEIVQTCVAATAVAAYLAIYLLFIPGERFQLT